MDEEDLAGITDATQRANLAWVRGNWAEGYGALLTGSDEATIYGPFGGPLLQGTRNWRERGARAAGQFSNGTSTLTVLASHCSGDLLVLVMLEEQRADIAGTQDHPWSLRVTQVYRREEGTWKVIHRHADPLVRSQPVDQALKLAAGGAPPTP